MVKKLKPSKRNNEKKKKNVNSNCMVIYPSLRNIMHKFNIFLVLIFFSILIITFNNF